MEDSKVYELILRLAAVGSTKDKQKLLADFEDPELLRRVCHATYNSYITYGIKKIPDVVEHAGELSLSVAIITVLDKLSDRQVTGNAAIELLKKTLSRLSQADAMVFSKIISRDLGCGISTKTINKVFPGLIPTFELMACHTLNSETKKHLKLPCAVQLKYDAARVAIIVSDGKVTYKTRNGLDYGLRNEQLDKAFLFAANGLDIVYDGELYQVVDGVIQNRTVSNGVATKFIRGTASDLEHASAMISVWDAVPLSDFQRGYCSVPYERRLDNITNNFPKEFWPETEIVHTLERVYEISTNYIAQGQEGVIAKNLDGVWEAKRVYQCMKVKAEIISEFRIIDMEEGTGKNKGRLGNLILQSEDGYVTFGCGIFKGHPEEIRDEFWQNKEMEIGTIVSILHNGLIKDNKGNYSVFLPRFIERRLDKNEADTLEKIKEGT